MEIESCCSCGIVYDKDYLAPEEETICVDARKGYYITYERMRCPNCSCLLIDTELSRTSKKED